MASENQEMHERPSHPPAAIDNSGEEKLGGMATPGTPSPISQDDHNDRPIEDARARISKRVWIVIVVTMMSSTFLFSLDNSVVADIQPSILKSVGGVGKLGWLGIAYTLSSLSTIIFWGKILGLFNVKWAYIVSIRIFGMGSAICGSAPNMDAMIIGRAIAGVGGAGMYVGCLALLSLTTTIRERPIYMASIGFTWGSGTALGPIIGGAFAENRYTTWRWAFYINLCIGALFAPAFLFLLPSIDPKKGVLISIRLKRLDYVGVVLSIGFLTAFVMAINPGGTVYAWDSEHEIALWVVSGLVFIPFCIRQKFSLMTTKENRLFPGDLLRMYDMWLLFICMVSAATCVFVPTYYIPLYFQFVRGDHALDAGVRLLPFICIMVFCGLLSGVLMIKSGYYMPWFLLGGCLTLTGGALMYTVGQDTSTSRIYGYMAITGAGAGLYIQASYGVAQAKVAANRVADAAGLMTFAQYLGITLSLAISGSVFQSVAFENLVPLFPTEPASNVRDIIRGTSSKLLSTLSGSMKQRVLAIIIDAISKTYVLVITAGAVTVVTASLMKMFFSTGVVKLGANWNSLSGISN
ncbi:major facilitator superfamily general substrate transporter [Fusarium sporotrichioides]|uniref:Major facilitator superfamily general substrate transporter n=1 Tax=Fusarium sporotrichioides TaxID=5514 RepID=A0A395RUK4_FUSSP|nr:major facilitator superfamily general substrate transporter [Fusarium sporotrichioides]